MNAYKTIFKLLPVVFIIQAMSVDADVDWSKVNCPKSSGKYIEEAIRIIVSGNQSNPDSKCLDQENFKYFNLSISDISDKPLLTPIILNDDFKYYIIESHLTKSGVLNITYKVTSGLNVFTDKFSLFFNGNEKGISDNGCVAFFDLPSKYFLKQSCQESNKNTTQPAK